MQVGKQDQSELNYDDKEALEKQITDVVNKFFDHSSEERHKYINGFVQLLE